MLFLFIYTAKETVVPHGRLFKLREGKNKVLILFFTKNIKQITTLICKGVSGQALDDL